MLNPLKLNHLVPKHTYFLSLWGEPDSVYFSKPSIGFEVFNDVTGVCVDIFDIWREGDFNRFCLEASKPFTDEEAKRLKAEWRNIEDTFERAVAFFRLARHCSLLFDLIPTEDKPKFPAHYHPNTEAMFSLLPGMKDFYYRLRYTQVEYYDWTKLLDKYNWDYENSFVFISLPASGLSEEELSLLLDQIDQATQKIMLVLPFERGGDRLLSKGGRTEEIDGHVVWMNY